MSTRILFLALAIAVGSTSCLLPSVIAAQERESESEPEEPSDEATKRARPPPTTGALPLEDPTIHPRQMPEASELPQDDADPTLDTDTQPDENLDTDTAPSTEAERTTGTAPVEDPTLDLDTEPDEEPPTEDDGEAIPPKPRQEKPQKEEDEGPNVRAVYDNGFLLSVDDWFFLALRGLVQARYTVNYRNDPPLNRETLDQDAAVTQGFDVARARFTLGVGLTEFVALVMRIGVVAGGEFSMQRAFIDLKWKFFRLRAGLFMNELIAESLVNPWDLYFIDYSIVENVFTPGSSKGIMMTYLRKRFSINLGYSDGLRTGFSEIRSAANADFAVTARAQFAWGRLGLTGFNRLNARRGTPFGARLGVALHYQDGGRTQGSLPSQIALGTIDLSVRGNGWSMLVSGIVGQDSTNATDTTEATEVLSSGVTAMGGYFVLENMQVFAQYSVVPKPVVRGTLDPDEAIGLEDDPSIFHALGVGMSYFVIPNFDNVKVSTDFQYFIGSQFGSLVPSAPLNGVQPNDAGSQFAWRLQVSGAF